VASCNVDGVVEKTDACGTTFGKSNTLQTTSIYIYPQTTLCRTFLLLEPCIKRSFEILSLRSPCHPASTLTSSQADAGGSHSLIFPQSVNTNTTEDAARPLPTLSAVTTAPPPSSPPACLHSPTITISPSSSATTDRSASEQLWQPVPASPWSGRHGKLRKLWRLRQ
jgi:hypothetical protein